MTADNEDEVRRIVSERVTAALAPRRADSEFAARLDVRIEEDGPLLDRIAHEHETCQSSDGPVRFYYEHGPTHGFTETDHVYVSCPHHQLDPLPNDGRWSITSVHPLTVTPSIHWTDCGCHGFITNGKWVAA